MLQAMLLENYLKTYAAMIVFFKLFQRFGTGPLGLKPDKSELSFKSLTQNEMSMFVS